MIWKLIARLLAKPSVANWLIKRAQRTPYSPIVKDGVLYMDRWWLFNPYPATGQSGADKSRWQFPISIRIHHIAEPDQDRDLHDHPWNARTVILRGGYIEVRPTTEYDHLIELPDGSKLIQVLENIERKTGDTATLKFGEFHRIRSLSPGGCYTMFITGPYRGTWGFLVDGVKVQWRKYLGIGD